MKVLYYDCFAGISGDMNLGALIDLGVDRAYLIRELQKLKVSGYEIRISQQQRKGITGTQVEVVLTDEHQHVHRHSHEHHHLGPASLFPSLKRRLLAKYDADTELAHSHDHRNLYDIEKIIGESALSDNVKAMSTSMFKLIAQAEARIHGKPLEEVHFHEVGAVDSIVDIVGAAICIDYLQPGRIMASPVEMGGGFVNCAHGRFPVPAPATLEIMKGRPMKFGAVPFEMSTPTGVAILAALAGEFTEKPAFTITKTGYGIGHRDTEIPNVLRVCIGETEETVFPEKTVDATVLECNIDDMNPEQYPYIMEQLFAAGADDVFLQTIIMKKTRPAVTISVLCTLEKVATMKHILFVETSTLGIRYYQVRKIMLDRRSETIDTPWGPVRIKEAYYQGKKLKVKPEYDDCAAIARNHNLSIEKVYEQVQHAISSESHNVPQ